MAYLATGREHLLITNFWLETPELLIIETASRETPTKSFVFDTGTGDFYYEALRTAINSGKPLIDWRALKKKVDEKLGKG